MKHRDRRRAVVFSLVTVLLIFTTHCDTAGRTRRRRCLPVKNEWRSKGFGDNQQVPSSPVSGVELSVCETWPRGSRSRGSRSRTLVSCCTRQMEARLTTHARHEFGRLITSQLDDVKHHLHNADNQFESLCLELIDGSGRELHDMFTRTYGILYQQNSQVFTELFHDLRTYYRGASELSLDHILDQFFSSLLLRMFTLLNGQYVFDDRYLACVSDRAGDLEPFGDMPQKLSVQVKRALIAARTFHQGLSLGADVISAVVRVGVDGECESSVTKMLYCPYCRGLVSVSPCPTYCNEVMTSCLSGHASSTQFTQAWNAYIDAMLRVTGRLEGPFNIERVLDPMDVKISEAIMNFQENAEAVTAKVFQVCGQPSLGMRSRRSTRRRVRGQGRRRGQGEGRRRGGRRRRRTTPSTMDHDDDDDFDVDGGYVRRRTVGPPFTSPVSSSTTLPPSTSDLAASSLWVNTTVYVNDSVAAEEQTSTVYTTQLTTTTSLSLPSTTDSRSRRTRRPRRNRNRASRRRKNRLRTATTPMTSTTAYQVDQDQRGLWNMERDPQPHRNSGSASRLERLIDEIRTKLTMNRDLVTNMPRSLCSTLTSTQRRCWNGTNYTRQDRAQQATGETSSNGYVTDWQNTGTAVSRIVARLKDMTDKLQNAYSGLDVQWSSAGQYVK